MKQRNYVWLFLSFLLVSLPVVQSFAQYDQTKCPPKKKSWRTKQYKPRVFYMPEEYSEPTDKQQKKLGVKEKVASTNDKKRAKKDRRYAKRLKAVKKENKLIVSSTQCPH